MPSKDLLQSVGRLLRQKQTEEHACFIHFPDLVIVGANDDLAATLSSPSGILIIGQHIFDVFPDNPETPEVNVRASLRRVMASKQPHEMAPEGIYCDLTYLARYNKAGQIDGFVTYTYDVTEQVYARRERENQRLRLQRLFLEAPPPFVS
ncbi:PAS domain-containing protein [Hymenobacter defluvii]|uniref:PAS domain-containing protein n=1 Tax=Hymenobacter defluvii TaxID=2054411 RepID=A0ABS3TBC5_9BACT|nr:PAS domain-containing protein [Hymenobacter defluvii]